MFIEATLNFFSDWSLGPTENVACRTGGVTKNGHDDNQRLTRVGACVSVVGQGIMASGCSWRRRVGVPLRPLGKRDRCDILSGWSLERRQFLPGLSRNVTTR
jgi:hypothetical protein